MQIRVEEGDGQMYLVGSRATRGITVVVTDEAGSAVSGASVNFSLPENGPTGVFADGSKNQLVSTKGDGRATVWGMRWNRQPGPVDVRVVAGKGSARAGTTITVQLSETAGPTVSAGPGSNHKWLWIGLAVAGAAGAGIAVAAKGRGSQDCSPNVVLAASPCPSSPDPLGVTVIGTPTITLGHP